MNAEIYRDNMRIYKLAKNVKSYIQQYKIQDPFLIFFLNKYESIIPWNQVQTPEDVQNYISQTLLPQLIEKTNPETEDNLYLKDIDLEAEFRNNQNNPQVQQAYQIYQRDPEQAKQTILDQVNQNKQEAFDSWKNYMLNQDVYKQNPAFTYSVLKPIFDLSPEDRKASVPSANALAIGNLYEWMQQKKDFNVAKAYTKALNEAKTQNLEKTDGQGIGDGWLHLPSKNKDPDHFEDNVNTLKDLSMPNNWCTGSGMAEPYLKNGDFWLLIENHQAKVAIRFEGDKIKEIQGPNNRRPFEYWQEIIDFVGRKGFDKDSTHFKELEACFIINQKLDSGDEKYWKNFLHNIESLHVHDMTLPVTDKVRKSVELFDIMSEKNQHDPRTLKMLKRIENKVVEATKDNMEDKDSNTNVFSDYHSQWAKTLLDKGLYTDNLTKIINDHIIQFGEPPHYAYDWTYQQIDAGKAPQEWMDLIYENLELYSKPSTSFSTSFWGARWAKEKCESGNPPKEVAEIASNAIIQYGDPPRWAIQWATKTLESGNAPAKWIDYANESIEHDGQPSQWIYPWAKKQIESGQFPKEWIEGITKCMEEHLVPPDFANEWVKKILRAGDIPPEWIPIINSAITDYRTLPDWLKEWAKEQLRGDVPPEFIGAMGNHIRQSGDVPEWMYGYASALFSWDKVPEEWISPICEYISKSGIPPCIARKWINKKIKSEDAPPQLIQGIKGIITEYLKTNGFPPKFLSEWAHQKMQSGQAPQEWVDAINHYALINIISIPGLRGPTPLYTWTKQKLESGQAPQEWIDAINHMILSDGYPPDIALPWAKQKLESGQAPQEWIDAIQTYFNKHGEPPAFASVWWSNQQKDVPKQAKTWYKLYKISSVPFKEKWYEPNTKGIPINRDIVNHLDELDLTHNPDMEEGLTLTDIIEQMFPNATPVGTGQAGIAYDIGNNQVLKITTDEYEAEIAAKIKDMNLRHVVNVYDIIPFYKYYQKSPFIKEKEVLYPRQIWGLIIEKVQPLSRQQILIADSIIQYMNEMHNPYVRDELYERVQQLKNEYGPISKYISTQLQVLHRELKRNNLECEDIRGLNLGWRNKDLVLLDLGGFV